MNCITVKIKVSFQVFTLHDINIYTEFHISSGKYLQKYFEFHKICIRFQNWGVHAQICISIHKYPNVHVHVI